MILPIFSFCIMVKEYFPQLSELQYLNYNYVHNAWKLMSAASVR